MPRSCWCKKCKEEMPVGDICPRCGGKLNPNQAHVVWQKHHTPVLDWMCWNAAARIALPALGAAVLLLLLLEWLLGGSTGIENLLSGSLLSTLLLVVLVLGTALLLGLYGQGEDDVECVVDHRGVTLRVYLPQPTTLKLLCRLRSPALMQQVVEKEPLLVEERTLPWKSVSRVQLWQEKLLVLLYAPKWWMRLAIPCDPFVWEEVLSVIREKLGASKKTELPAALRQHTPPRRKKQAPRADQHPAPFMEKQDTP